MKLSEISAATLVTARVSPVDGVGRLAEGPLTVRLSEFPGEYDLVQRGSLCTVALQNRGDAGELNFALGTGRARLTWLRAVAPDGSAELRLALFNGVLVEMEEVEVGLDEGTIAAARRAFGRSKAPLDELIGLLTDACVIQTGPDEDDAYFLFTTGPAAEAELEEEKTAGGDSAAPAGPTRSFCIHGEGVRLVVARRQKTPTEEIFLASGLTRSRAGQSDGACRLARGKLFFSDYTKTAQIQILASGQMAKLLTQESSYLRRWDQYGEAEGRVLLDRARAIGALKIVKAESSPEGLTFFFDRPVPREVSVGDELELTRIEPAYLQNPSMGWNAFCELLKTQEAMRMETAKVLAVAEHSVTVNLRVTPPAAGDGLMLVFSMNGERIQIGRRMQARSQVQQGRSANPLLGLLIEDNAEIPETARPPKLRALTGFVRAKVFPRRTPTEMQEKAIEIALNTPDIALIQGPPGTGKTTVIAAILERLNEMSDKRKSIRGEVLLTGFQHDAVENLMFRLTVNSLPVPKYGRRSNEETDGMADLTSERVRQWCDLVAARLRERTPALAATEHERSLVQLAQQYAFAPTLDHAIHMLEVALALPRITLGDALAQRLLEQKAALEDEMQIEAGGGGEMLFLARALRTTPEAFADDGPARAAEALAAGGAALLEQDKALLEKAIRWREPSAPPFLADLGRFRRRLLERFTPRPFFQVEKAREEVVQVIADVMERVRRCGRDRGSQTAAVLADLLGALEGDPAAVEEAVAEYSYAFAATCQQSRGGQIHRAKGTKTPVYDTVIVDEAARVGPRDLLIPMSQARKRIILVGDHRQLPQMVDDEVVRALEHEETGLGRTGAESQDQIIKESMFQHLFQRLAALEQKDGICRRVTLDQQFRMHRMLGDFVNRHFYAPYPNEAFSSPLDDDLFFHGLSETGGAPAVWLDVPASSGEETRSGTSRSRREEAERIAAQLHRWIDSEEGKHLSFGIIAFYKAQIDEINAALSRHGYTHRVKKSWEVSKDYAFLPSVEERMPEERLRIGTVDSFQGMEFDVVFLSVVRSRSTLPTPAHDKATIEKQARKFFGHLMSVNRLCVSVSRQKRLLVVAGDAAMVTHRLGRKAVPALADFHRLCGEKGVIL